MCGNVDAIDPCSVCAAHDRDMSVICVVQEVGDLWALERAGVFKGRYHVLGGVLSALDGVRPEDLNIEKLLARAAAPEIKEVILALSATVDGAATAHYLADRLHGLEVEVSSLARGVPVGGELDHLDDGSAATVLAPRPGRGRGRDGQQDERRGQAATGRGPERPAVREAQPWSRSRSRTPPGRP